MFEHYFNVDFFLVLVLIVIRSWFSGQSNREGILKDDIEKEFGFTKERRGAKSEQRGVFTEMEEMSTMNQKFD